MLSVRLCHNLVAPLRCSFPKSPQHLLAPAKGRVSVFRTFADDSRQTWTRRRKTLKEVVSQPTQGTPFAVGRAAVIGGSAFGIGALCYYGLVTKDKAGFINHSMLWPDYVKERIRATYMYFGSSLIVTAASAAAIFRSPVMLNLVTKNSILAMVVTMGAMIGSGVICQSIPYEPGFGVKQMAWLLHSGIIGGVLAPVCFLGGPLVLRAAVMTAGVVGGLSCVAAFAPSDKFLYMGGPLAMGLGVVIASSIGSMFLPPTTMLGAGLYSMSLYGGLLLFSGFLLYDTQRIVRAAETMPEYGYGKFDPINASVSIYIDTINIFVRILTILSGGGGNKRK